MTLQKTTGALELVPKGQVTVTVAQAALITSSHSAGYGASPAKLVRFQPHTALANQ